jgi:hypothetical protein
MKILFGHPQGGNHEDLYPKFELLCLNVHFTAHQKTVLK